MFEIASSSTLGDSVYNEDEDTIALEKQVAELAGKESGLFCVSGTLSNQIAIRTNLNQPPHTVLCDYRSHIFIDEAGGLATLSQAMVTPVRPKNGIYLTLEEIVENFIDDDGDIHVAPTKIVSLENTNQGLIYPIEEIARISKWCRKMGVRLHLDGARLWNASSATGISIKEYCQYFDSVSLCLSKSLGAPVGSVLVSTSEFIKKANHFRKQNGGGIRQAGFLAKMASYAVSNNLPELKKANDMALDLLSFCDSKQIKLQYPTHTNFVWIDMKLNSWEQSKFDEICSKHNCNTMGGRISFHFQISEESLRNIKAAIEESNEYFELNPYVPENDKRSKTYYLKNL